MDNARTLPAPHSGDSRTFPLGGGTLAVRVVHADWPLDALCAFAARDNPRRAFLVVSKVLGRHIGTPPATMRATFRDLAARIPADLPGPVLVIGLAETAICLGQGVHEDYVRLTGRGDVLFLHSTRQLLDHPVLARFEEPHSHASSHLIYQPHDLAGDFAAPRSLIMVDDEISTGTTLTNLAAAMTGALPSIETVVAATLTDWSLGHDWMARVGRPAQTVSLLSGTLAWTGRQAAARSEDRQFETSARALGTMAQHRNFGRLGRMDIAQECDELANFDFPPASRVRVVGTGEFTYPPFRIAEALAAAGHDVVVQSATRSPVHIDGPIACGLRFTDNYGTGVANYLYNADPADGRATIVCHETPRGSIDPALIAALSAQSLYFGDDV
ncbi:phosphoribosyltransferase domain-containing protein [Novosphingobium sp. Chol11]|uniref:phosphoribosyltransferase domain-containing protein n=1 Tax=Novosphingobium sp. Chol11 TaxID=1385763 RepID=UPI0025FFD714|nr:phosphoribosyltransferase domain-containing protein [Novosphingobium sp. Chol11]